MPNECAVLNIPSKKSRTYGSTCLLQCINEFEASNPQVVTKLRELKDSTDRYRDASSWTDAGGGGGGDPTSNSTQTHAEDRGVEMACGGEGTSTWDAAAWTQSDTGRSVDTGTEQIDCGGFDMSTMTEEELKEKHSQVSAMMCSFRGSLRLR